MRCATSPSRCSATARRSASGPTQMPVFGTMASRFNDDGVTALYQAMLPRLADARPRARRRHAAQGADAPQHAPGADRAAGARAPTSPTSPTRCAPTSARRSAQARLAREIQQLRASARMLLEANPDKTNAVGAVNALADEREARLDAARAPSCSPTGRRCSAPTRGDEYVVTRARQRDPHAARPHDAVRQQDPEGRAADATRTTARS